MKQTEVVISADGFWNGAIQLEHALSQMNIEYVKSLNLEDVEIDGRYIRVDCEQIRGTFKSRKDAKEFLNEFIMRAGEDFREGVYGDTYSLTLISHRDDSPFERGQYMSDGEYY